MIHDWYFHLLCWISLSHFLWLLYSTATNLATQTSTNILLLERSSEPVTIKKKKKNSKSWSYSSSCDSIMLFGYCWITGTNTFFNYRVSCLTILKYVIRYKRSWWRPPLGGFHYLLIFLRMVPYMSMQNSIMEYSEGDKHGLSWRRKTNLSKLGK